MSLIDVTAVVFLFRDGAKFHHVDQKLGSCSIVGAANLSRPAVMEYVRVECTGLEPLHHESFLAVAHDFDCHACLCDDLGTDAMASQR